MINLKKLFCQKTKSEGPDMDATFMTLVVPRAEMRNDEQAGRQYLEMKDGLRLYFENGEYVGFSTQAPNPEG